jgi:flagellar biosynthesis protein FlhG
MTVFIPVASGKGGTGKTLFSTNLGVSLALLGKTVILIDLDLGGSNLHTCLGIMNTGPGIGSLIYKKEHNIESLLTPTGIGRLHFIAGDSLLPGTANLEYSAKKRLIKGIKGLVADYVIMDLGSGTSFNTVDFFLIAPDGIIVTTPEITSILNAYSFIKTALYRLLYLLFPARSEERKVIAEFVTSQIEGEKKSFLAVLDLIYGVNPESGERCRAELKSFLPRIILNNVRAQSDIATGEKLIQTVAKNLGIRTVGYGMLAYDPEASKSIAMRKPLVLLSQEAQYSKGMAGLSRKIASHGPTSPLAIFEPDGDFESLGEKLGTLQ